MASSYKERERNNEKDFLLVLPQFDMHRVHDVLLEFIPEVFFGGER